MSQSTLPIIDISTHSPAIAQEVLSAASTHGFLFIKNDAKTIPQRDIDEMFALVRPFSSPPLNPFLNSQVKILLLHPAPPKIFLRNPHPLRRRPQPRLGAHVRRSARRFEFRPQGSV